MEEVHEGGIRFQAAQVVDDHGQHGQIQHDLQPQASPRQRCESLAAHSPADHGEVGRIDHDQNRGDRQGPRRIQTDPVTQERACRPSPPARANPSRAAMTSHRSEQNQAPF